MYVTSNVFYGNEALAGEKGFSSVDEMNAYIVEKWNEKVPKNGVVYLLGNLAKDPVSIQEFLAYANGNIRAIQGEYDQALIEVSQQNLFGNISFLYDALCPVDVRDMDGNMQGVVLSYWPLEEWPGMEGGTMHMYGRGHRWQNDPSSKRINASFWVWDGPLSFQTLVDLQADIVNLGGFGGEGATSS